MGERKSHVKSRLGCAQCKSRRVKCDEKRPSCGNCKRRQEECSYKSSTTSIPSPNGGLDETSGETISYELHVKQMQLLHHYLTSTCHTLAVSPQTPIMQQLDVPQLGFRHKYLLDTIFAITTLHIATTSLPHEVQDLVAEASRYQARALMACRQHVQDLNAMECQALFHCSAKLGVITLALRAVDPETAATPPTDTLVQLSALWRGTWVILRTSRDLMDPETYEMFFPPPEWSAPIDPPSPQIKTVLDTLRKIVKSTHNPQGIKHDQEEKETGWESGPPLTPLSLENADPETVYLAVIDLLELLFRVWEPEPSRILAWLVQVPAAYMDMLTAHEPLACAIALLWSVTFGSFDGKWWTTDFRRQLVEELAPIVRGSGGELAEVLSWVGD